MTMHLEKAWLSTTSTKKKETKLTKKQEAELQQQWRDRNKWLKENRLPTMTYDQFKIWVFGAGPKTKSSAKKSSLPSVTRDGKSLIGKSGKDHIHDCTKVSSPQYTGDKVIGIAVQHKSCLQPIFNEQAAKDSASMRR